MSARVFDSVMEFHGKAILSPFVDGVLERAKTDGGRGGGGGFNALCWVGNPAGKPPHGPDTVDTWPK